MKNFHLKIVVSLFLIACAIPFLALSIRSALQQEPRCLDNWEAWTYSNTTVQIDYDKSVCYEDGSAEIWLQTGSIKANETLTIRFRDKSLEEPNRIAITQAECLELFGNSSSACKDWTWQDRETYYIKNEPVAPYPECDWYRGPSFMTFQPWIWTPCFEQSWRKLISCGDSEGYILSVSFSPDFDWINCQLEKEEDR